MSRHTIDLHAVSAEADPSPRHLVVGLYAEPEANRAHLERCVGAAVAARVLARMERGEIRGQYREFNLLPGEDEGSWQLFVGLGSQEDLRRGYRRDDRLRSLVAIGARHFRRMGIRTFTLQDLTLLGPSVERVGAIVAEGALLGTYRYDLYKTRPSVPQTQRVRVQVHGASAPLQAALDQARATAVSVCEARDLVNAPSSDLRPMDAADQAEAMAAAWPSLHFTRLGRAELEAEGMGMLLAVARGSEAEPCLAVMEHRPEGCDEDTPVALALVGKGVTFDSGGYDIKSSAGMRRMFRDMAGSAAVFGAMQAIAAAGLPIRVVGVMALAENMISGEAFRPGDILRSRKGLTVEIANTDAEGRLVLGDALDWVVDRYAPDTLVNIATLTGAVRSALGLFVSGLMTHSPDDATDEALAQAFHKAGQATGEWVWGLPCDLDYKVQLSSRVADLANCNVDSKSGAGAVTAAVFLRQFVDFDVVRRWAHLDIAATAYMERTVIYNKVPYMPKEGATGVGVRLLTDLARRIADGL